MGNGMNATRQAIFWDWDGVLGTRKFWHKSVQHDAVLADFAATLFADKELVRRWMRGESLEELLREDDMPYPSSRLREMVRADWQGTEVINVSLFSAIAGLYPGAKQYIVTDNMDIATDFFKTNEFVKDNFAKVFNSSDYSVLKEDSPSLYEKVLAELDMASFAGCLCFDDSEINCHAFRRLGGEAVLVQRNRVS